MLIDDIATIESLTQAWEHVRSRAGTREAPDGSLNRSKSIQRFEKDAERRIAVVCEELRTRNYQPGALTRVQIPKSDGSLRDLAIAPIVDRVVERAIYERIVPIVDRWLSHAAFAYRSGVSIADAVARVCELRDSGSTWVLRSDVTDCFPTIPRDLAIRRLQQALPDSSLEPLLHALFERPVRIDGVLREQAGVPQGAALAPLVANLMLTDLDDALACAGFQVVRYADDFVVPVKSESEAWEAARCATHALEGLGMDLSAEKSQVMSFEQGFVFMGEEFGPKYPPAAAPREDVPRRRSLFLARPGSRVWIRQGRIVVTTKNDVDELSVPSSHVGRILCFGPVGLSSGLRTWAFQNHVSIVYLSAGGKVLGTQQSTSADAAVSMIRRQFAAVDDADFAAVIGRTIVDAKLSHQRTVLLRFTRRDRRSEVREASEAIAHMRSVLVDAHTRDEIMGVEGAAAAAYFGALGELVPEPVRFDRRSRRPPLDVVNSALGFGYALLLAECTAALYAAGLNPGIGMLHATTPSRPSLALDLMEEFRPLIVDQVVVEAFRKGSLTLASGRPSDDAVGVWLTKDGKSALIDAYETRLLTGRNGALPKFEGSTRRLIFHQAHRLAAAIESGDPAKYSGLSWRP